MDKIENKIPLVVFSGGVDSTALLIYYFSHNIPHATCYAQIPNNAPQHRRELTARKRIIDKLTKIYGNYHTKDTIISGVYSSIKNPNRLSPLAYTWLWSIVYGIDLQHYSQIDFGYIRSDCFWHYAQSVREVYTQMMSITTFTPPKLAYPLEWYTKQGVYDTFYAFDKNVLPVFDLTYTCEIGKVKPCGKCNKCIDFSLIRRREVGASS